MPPQARQLWFRDYLRTVIQRDIKDLSGARRTQDLPKLLKLLAARTAGRAGGEEPARRHRVWESSHHRGIPRVPTDDLPGAAAARLGRGISLARPPADRRCISPTAVSLLTSSASRRSHWRVLPDPARGQIIESFAVNEMYRQASWHRSAITLHHFRDRGGVEIDVVAEAADGRLVAVEIKSGPAVNRSDARHLRWLRDKVSDDFRLRRRPAYRRTRLPSRRPHIGPADLMSLDHFLTSTGSASVWVPIIRSWALTRGFALHPGTRESVHDAVHEDSASARIATGQRPRPSFRHPQGS